MGQVARCLIATTRKPVFASARREEAAARDGLLRGAAAFTNIRAIRGTMQTRMSSKLGLVHNI
jgi:hypothetical protein